MRTGQILFLMLMGLLGVARAAHSCSCSQVGTGPVSIEGLAAVFSGEVVAVTLLEQPIVGGRPGEFQRRLAVKFRVWESWKGVESGFVSAETGLGGGDCGYPFKIAERYLVFAYASDSGSLEVSTCSHTTEESEAKRVRKDIGPALRQFAHRVPGEN